MSNPPTVFDLYITTESYEPAGYYGTYASPELAQLTADFILANWEGSYAPDQSCVRIEPKTALMEVPEVHLWYCSIDLKDPTAEPTLQRTPQPSLSASEPSWERLDDPARFVRFPMRFVAGSGQTPALAEYRARAHYAEALRRGVPDILTRVERVCAEARSQLDAKALAAGLVPGGYSAFWDDLQTLQEELMEKEFGAKPEHA